MKNKKQYFNVQLSRFLQTVAGALILFAANYLGFWRIGAAWHKKK